MLQLTRIEDTLIAENKYIYFWKESFACSAALVHNYALSCVRIALSLNQGTLLITQLYFLDLIIGRNTISKKRCLTFNAALAHSTSLSLSGYFLGKGKL